MIIEDKILVRLIKLDDHIEGIPFNGDTFLIKEYSFNWNCQGTTLIPGRVSSDSTSIYYSLH
jgi:hypothetical protein